MVTRVWIAVQTVCSIMIHHSACLLLLLLLTCLAVSASETEQGGTMGLTSYGPSSVEISGVDVVTVGIPYGFQCSANCYPGCQYSWTRGNVTSQGPELSLQLLHIVPIETLTCTVVNPSTGKSATVQKTLHVTAGPSNIHISGPPNLKVGVASVFTCSANCYPSCSYSWTVVVEEEVFNTTQGNTISVSPAGSTVVSETLICEAQDTVSHLFVSTALLVYVTSESDISISGDSTVTMGKQYTFICLVTCIPSCSITWKYMGKTFQGDQISIPILHQAQKRRFANQLEITFSDYSKIEPLTCEATNIISQATIAVTKNLTVIDPISVRPTTQALPVAGKSFSLQCVGSQNPASVTWLKNKRPVPASEGMHFSPDNITMTFSPLLQTDDGLYQCVVAEGGTPIQSVGYKMQVNYGPSSVAISGVNVVTVGILYGFQCWASCYPTCLFTWTRGDVTSQGPELSLQIKEVQPTQNLTCMAVNPATKISATAQKMLQITAGPSNIHISGPAFLTAGVASNFTCSANCYPSCSYTWTLVLDEEMLSVAQGNTISVTPPVSALICQAQDTVSHLYVSTTLPLQVASLSDITITGDSLVAMGKQYMYTCSATCVPSCAFTWKYMGKTLNGSQIQTSKPKFASQLEITISDFSKSEPLTCEVTNTASQATITATKNLTVIDPFSVHPITQGLPIAGKPFSLKCVGPQSPASITWLKNKLQMLTIERVMFSSDNTTVTFSPLLQGDGGVYQCLVLEGGNRTLYYDTLVVAEGGTPILSIGYLMQVNYGPDEVLIVKPKEGPVGEEMFTLPGSTTELQCLTDCFPACSIAWFYQGKLLATNASIFFTPVTPPYEAALTCVAFNSVTMTNRTAETTVVVPDGPKNVTIAGPQSLEIGVTATFTCSAECTPLCSFTWTLYGKTMTGRVIDITLNRQVSTESFSCQAENTFTGKTAMINETLSVSDPHWCGC